MTMTYNRDYAEDVVALVRDFEKSFRDMMAETRKISPPINEQAKPTNEQFMAWFEMKAAENPNWVLALPYVQDGPALLARYERLVGLNAGVA